LTCSEKEIAWIGDSIAEVIIRAWESPDDGVRNRKAVDSPTLLDFAKYP
jgi:hypothetical protein